MAIRENGGVKPVTVQELLREPLTIPPYQRPYSWSPAIALQLLDDVADAHASSSDQTGGNSGSYVLGAAILHQDEQVGGRLNVVDGQQRLLTLLMILRLLDGRATTSHADEDPNSAVVRARSALAARISPWDEAKRVGVADFVRQRCQLVRIVTDDADEAFRVFDSQNYRGKPLLPHDLLKAFHLREMSFESDPMKAAVVEAWESVEDVDLDRLFSAYLWRIQCWSRGVTAPVFETRHVDAFKGIRPGTASSPSAKYHMAAHGAVPLLTSWAKDSADLRHAARSRFQLDAPVVAGRGFFEMVTFMLTELSTLRREGFEAEGWEQYASNDAETLRESPSLSRYRYVTELYLAALLYCTNKFGDEDLDEARQRLFVWAYELRTDYQRLQFATVNNRAAGVVSSRVSKAALLRPSAFFLLRNASTPKELRRLVTPIEGVPGDEGHQKHLKELLKGLVHS